METTKASPLLYSISLTFEELAHISFVLNERINELSKRLRTSKTVSRYAAEHEISDLRELNKKIRNSAEENGEKVGYELNSLRDKYR